MDLELVVLDTEAERGIAYSASRRRGAAWRSAPCWDVPRTVERLAKAIEFTAWTGRTPWIVTGNCQDRHVIPKMPPT